MVTTGAQNTNAGASEEMAHQIADRASGISTGARTGHSPAQVAVDVDGGLHALVADVPRDDRTKNPALFGLLYECLRSSIRGPHGSFGRSPPAPAPTGGICDCGIGVPSFSQRA